MQQQVHEEHYLVAKQHIWAVEGATGTCQVVDIYSRAKGSKQREMTNIINKLNKTTPQGQTSISLQEKKNTTEM